jgi:hypothetical protein
LKRIDGHKIAGHNKGVGGVNSFNNFFLITFGDVNPEKEGKIVGTLA